MIIAVLDRVRSLYNVGSFFRTCDGAGVDQLILTDYTPTPPRSQIKKTALGAEETVKWQHFEHLEDAIHYLKNEGITVYAVEIGDSAKHYAEVTYPEKVAFVFGNEVTGVSEEALGLVDGLVALPMRGVKHSLNVASSAAVILYEASRQHFGETL